MNLPNRERTDSATRALALAQLEAARRGAEHVEPEHILLGILGDKKNLALQVLAALRIDPRAVACRLVGHLPPLEGEAESRPPLGEAARLVLHGAGKEADLLRHRYIDALHLLSGVLYVPQSRAAEALLEQGISLHDLRQHVMQQAARFKPKRSYQWRQALRPSPIFLIPLGLMLASGGGLYFGAPEAAVPLLTTLFVISGWITSVCIHEFGHALAAYLGGDFSVRDAGYLTLNPVKYTHPLLSIVLPVLYVLMGGIGLPGGAVYVDTRALRSKRWESLTSAAGPLGTLLFGTLIGWPFLFDWTAWVTEQNFYFWPALAVLAFLQVSSLVLNLIPLPPLDGFGIIAPLFTWELRHRMYMVGNMLLMLLFLALWQDGPLTDAFWSTARALAGILRIPLDLVWAGWQQFLF